MTARQAMPGIPVFPRLRQPGLRECDSVAMAAMEHLGKSYRITRELSPGLIDCSTVISQAHWTGAAIQTPFVAESQRLATNAAVVTVEDLLPGDAVYAYPSRRHSPGGRHNHVVLYLGEDEDGTIWAIESREETGAVLITLDRVLFGGGIRRFCLNPLSVFPAGAWSELAARVPKLARLGARLTAAYGTCRRHRGTDVYVADDCVVVSPLAGSIVDVMKIRYHCSFIGIWSSADRIYSVVGPVTTAAGISPGRDVDRGATLGGISSGAGPGGCNIIPAVADKKRVHFELWAPADFGTSPAPDLRCDWLPRAIARERDLIPHNLIYAVKLGAVGSVVSCPTGS
jgi:hypothetical protein